jgi:4-hydroxybenzoate polyprenyltransferase
MDEVRMDETRGRTAREDGQPGHATQRFATPRDSRGVAHTLRHPSSFILRLVGICRKILEMIRFSHTLFALPFAILAAVMAWSVSPNQPFPGAFGWRQLVGILVCMVCARSAAMAFNRLADRHLDAQNPRTNQRHLVRGDLSVSSVVVFTLMTALGFVAGTLMFLPNWLPAVLSAPVLAFLCGYSYVKRFTSLAHFWLGTALMLAPVCTWIAIRGDEVLRNPADILPAFFLGLAVLPWVAGFDIIYACQDVESDRRATLHSLPAKFGVVSALRIAAACHAAMIVVLLSLPWTCPELGLGSIFIAGTIAVALLLIYEHWIVSADDLTRVNVAFFQLNAVVSIGLLVIGTLDVLT